MSSTSGSREWQSFSWAPGKLSSTPSRCVRYQVLLWHSGGILGQEWDHQDRWFPKLPKEVEQTSEEKWIGRQKRRENDRFSAVPGIWGYRTTKICIRESLPGTTQIICCFLRQVAAAVRQLRLGHRRKLKIVTSVKAIKLVYNKSKC